MNFYKRHIGDYIKKAGHLTLLEHGIYSRLMDVYYTREAGIPEDKTARLIGARSKDELNALSNVLDEFFTLVDGTWMQGRCEEEIGNASAKADMNRKNGTKGGRPRKTQTEQQTQGNPHGSDVGNHVGSKNNLSQTPDSRLQTPDKELEPPPQASSAVGEPEPGSAAATPNRTVQIAVLLRAMDIQATTAHPLVCMTWAEDPAVSDEVLKLAVATARESKPGERIPVNYLKGIVERLAHPVAAKGVAPVEPPKKDWL